MSGAWAGVSGLAPSSAAIQARAAEVDHVMGRRPSETPHHLTRMLYIPRHTSATTHLPIYDVSKQYSKAEVGTALVGSTMFSIRLSLMDTPREDGTDASVQYLVDFQTTFGDAGGGFVSAKVQQRALGNAGTEVDLLLQPSSDAEFTLKVASNNPFRNRVPVRMTFPLPDSITRGGVARHPYFSFSLPGSTATLEWQVHPVEHGPLQYTLVAVDSKSVAEAGAAPMGHEVQAIYHHKGLGASLSTMQHSEGVLLLPACHDAHDTAQEVVIVATLLGSLSRLRGMVPRARRMSEGGPRKSLFGKMLRKRSTG